MKPENVLTLIIAYYLSKFDQAAYSNLGYKSMNEAHKDIGMRFGVNPNSVRNMRDEFDSVHDNPRAGFYQRELRPSRKRVINMFHDLSEQGLREIVKSILNNQSYVDSETFEIINTRIQNSEKDRNLFYSRGQTGKRAEEFFIKYQIKCGVPHSGDLIDTRDMGCGYDFEISTPSEKYYVEVKGIDKNQSGILFTDKEWFMANKYGEKYYLVIVNFVSGEAEVSIVNNPAAKLAPKQNIYTTVQINWNVSYTELQRLLAT